MNTLTTIDTIWYNVVQPDSSKWTSQISYDVVALLLRVLSDWAAPINFVTIAAKYNGPLEAAHEHIDDDRYYMVVWQLSCCLVRLLVSFWLFLEALFQNRLIATILSLASQTKVMLVVVVMVAVMGVLMVGVTWELGHEECYFDVDVGVGWRVAECTLYRQP